MASIAPLENREAVYDINKRADYGYIAYEEYEQLIADAVNISREEVREIFRKQHVRNEPLIDFVRSLRSQYKTALLSNVGHSAINKIFAPEELEGLFDVVTLSADIGVVKPSPRIYQITAEQLGFQPEECIMIDDIERNVKGAENAGMKGLLFVSNNKLEADLSALLEQENARAA